MSIIARTVVKIKNIIERTLISLDSLDIQPINLNIELINKPASKIEKTINIGIVTIKLNLARPDVSKLFDKL